MELLEDFLDEMINNTVILQIPINLKLKPPFSNRITIALSHLLIKTDYKLHGIKILNGNFQLAELIIDQLHRFTLKLDNLIIIGLAFETKPKGI